MMTQGTLVDATCIEAPSSTKNKEHIPNGSAEYRPERGNVALWPSRPKFLPGVCPQPGHHRGQRALTSISWVLLHGEEHLSQPMPATKGTTARGAGRGGCGLADR